MSCAKLLICDDHPPIRAAVTHIAKELNQDIGRDETPAGVIFPAWLRQLWVYSDAA